jgi:hypothetical protein
MSKHTFFWMVVACAFQGSLWAADDPFVGKWRLNPDKSTLTDQMRIEAVGENKYALTFAGGDPETVVADGTDQPALFGSTLAVTIEQPDTWKVVRKANGRTIITAIWKLSADGKTLTDNFTGIQADGSKLNLNVAYKRTAGSSGIPGTWESTNEKVDSVYEIEIRPYQNDGLAFITPAQKTTLNMKFDGKDYPSTGPGMPQGSVSQGRRLNERSLERIDKIQGKVTDKQQIEVSPDLKTLTMTVHATGQSEPSILVFERQ